MTSDRYDCLRIRVDRGVAWVTIDHPPISAVLPKLAD